MQARFDTFILQNSHNADQQYKIRFIKVLRFYYLFARKINKMTIALQNYCRAFPIS